MAKKDTMRITIRSRLRSYMYNRVQYLRGKVYNLDRPLAEALLATGEFKIAVLPPPDPRAKKRAKAAAIVDTLAGLPDDSLDKLLRLADMSAKESKDAGQATLDSEDEAEIVGVDLSEEEDDIKVKPKGVITTESLKPEEAKEPKQARRAPAEGDKPKKKVKAKKTARKPKKAKAETLADL